MKTLSYRNELEDALLDASVAIHKARDLAKKLRLGNEGDDTTLLGKIVGADSYIQYATQQLGE